MSNLSQHLTDAASLVVVAGPTLALIGWAIDARVKKHTSQLRPNGGSHLADAVTRTEQSVKDLQSEFRQRTDKQDKKLRRLRRQFEAHMATASPAPPQPTGE